MECSFKTAETDQTETFFCAAVWDIQLQQVRASMKPPTCAALACLVAGLAHCPRGVLSEGPDGPEFTGVTCPSSCSDLFGRIDEHGVQEVEFQLRGGEGREGVANWVFSDLP